MANNSAEKLLLAGFIRNPSKFFDVCNYLDEEDFNSESTKITFDAIKNLLLTKQIDKISKQKLIAEATSLGHTNYISATKNGVWLDELFKEVVSEEEVGQNFLEVKRHSLIAGYLNSIDEAKQYLKSTSDPISKIISGVEDKIISKFNILDKGEKAIRNLTQDIWKHIDSMADQPGNLGIDLGFPIWQSAIGQVRNKSLTFVAATAKAGKSQLALKIAAIVARKYNIPVILVDSELNAEDQQTRLVGMLAEVPFNYIENGYWKLSENELLAKGIEPDRVRTILEYGVRMRDQHLRDVVSALPIDYQSISGMDISEVIPHMRRWILTKVKPDKTAKHPQCLIIHDYIKLASTAELKKGIAEWQLHGINVAALHDFIKEFNVPAIAFGQTNNELDNGFKCIAGGKRISENASSISYLKAKTSEEKNIDSNGSHIMKVFGARYGSSLGPDGYININADLSIGKFFEVGLGKINFEEEKKKRLKKWKDDRESDEE